MTDLDAAIRERLALHEDGNYFRYDSELIQAAILAVLDAHAAADNPQRSAPWCFGCSDYYEFCQVRKVLAEKLEIEL